MPDLSTHQQVFQRLAEGPATSAQLAESLGHGVGYMYGVMRFMTRMSLVTRSEGKPAIYTKARTWLPEDCDALDAMLSVYGRSDLSAAVQEASIRADREERARQDSDPDEPIGTECFGGTDF